MVESKGLLTQSLLTQTETYLISWAFLILTQLNIAKKPIQL